MRITKLIKDPIVTFGQSDDDYVQNVATCIVAFATYSGTHEVVLKFPIEIMPEDRNHEELSHHPVMEMIIDKVNACARLRIYLKPINLVNRLLTLKKDA